MQLFSVPWEGMSTTHVTVFFSKWFHLSRLSPDEGSDWAGSALLPLPEQLESILRASSCKRAGASRNESGAGAWRSREEFGSAFAGAGLVAGCCRPTPGQPVLLPGCRVQL